jgi:hypothetical protein
MPFPMKDSMMVAAAGMAAAAPDPPPGAIRFPPSRRAGLRVGLVLWLTLHLAPLATARPICLDPINPHYFLFRGRATILITSGEHYGAVLNRDFNYREYLDTLRVCGLNLTRTFSGAYVEPSGAFKIAHNTLAPAPGSFLSPWARSLTPGYANGGNKFDLSQWDPAYFERLRDFVSQASRRGIVVELNLFCPMYSKTQWALSPQNAANNINGVGAVARTNVYTLDRNDGLLAVQDSLVRKIVAELKPFDNLYYEICNEPYFGGVTLAWQHHIADTIRDAEAGFRYQHLISRNVANGRAKVEHPSPAVSIFNFHYANPPDTVALNYALDKVIGDNETGFRGTNNAPYRREAWEFILAGGGLFNNLDYSFTVGHEDGTFVYPATQPGGGNTVLRRQFSILHRFIDRFPFTRMQPDNSILRGGLPKKATACALVEPGRRYALYLYGGHQANPVLAVPPGRYRAEWINPLTGHTDKTDAVDHPGGNLTLASPAYGRDIALRLVRVSGARTRRRR